MVVSLSMRIVTQLAVLFAAVVSPAMGQDTATSFIPNYSAGGVYGLWSSEADFDTGGGSLQMTEAGVSAPIPIRMDDKIMMWTGVRIWWKK